MLTKILIHDDRSNTTLPRRTSGKFCDKNQAQDGKFDVGYRTSRQGTIPRGEVGCERDGGSQACLPSSMSHLHHRRLKGMSVRELFCDCTQLPFTFENRFTNVSFTQLTLMLHRAPTFGEMFSISYNFGLIHPLHDVELHWITSWLTLIRLRASHTLLVLENPPKTPEP